MGDGLYSPNISVDNTDYSWDKMMRRVDNKLEKLTYGFLGSFVKKVIGKIKGFYSFINKYE